MDHPYEYDLVCIGAGPAGRRAAVQAAKLGKRVAILEKQRAFAGLGAQGGTIPSKTLREAIRAYKLGLHAGPFQTGHAPERPDLSAVRERIAEVCESEAVNAADQLHRNGVDLLSGKARFVDAH